MAKKNELLMKEQLENYGSLLSATEKLKAVLGREGEEARIEEILLEREKLIAAISRVDEEIKKVSENPDEGIAPFKDVLEKIIRLDGECGELLNRNRTLLADQIRNFGKTSTAMKGYGGPQGGGSGKFISIKK